MQAVTADDLVVVPRHVADAAYHVLQAMHALKDDGGAQLFAALGRALNRGAHHLERPYPPPCADCSVEVAQGFPHRADCASDEAVRYRAVPIPQLDPDD